VNRDETTALSGRARRVVPLVAILLVCLFLLSVVTARAVRAYLEMRNLRQVQAGAALGVRPWMTIPYIANTYGVPEDALFQALNLPKTPPNRHAPLEAIARREHRDLDADIATLNRVIDARGTPRPPPRHLPPFFPQRSPTPAPRRTPTPVARSVP
jgi:hypothetical protein